MDILLFIVAVVYIGRSLSEQARSQEEVRRLADRVTLRRGAVARAPQSPAAYESLGDALRESGQYAEAMQSFEQARYLMAMDATLGSGSVAGGGIETKLKLTGLDITEERSRPSSYVAQIAARSSVCRQCSTVNTPNAKYCVSCDNPLLANTFLEAWQREDLRNPILREVREGAVICAVIGIALYICSWMPLEIKGVLAFATLIVLVWKGLRAITHGRMAG